MIEEHYIQNRKILNISDEEMCKALEINLDTLHAIENQEIVHGHEIIELRYQFVITETMLEGYIIKEMEQSSLIDFAIERIENFLYKGWSKESLTALVDKLKGSKDYD